MEYRIIIQENLDGGAIHMHILPSNPCTIDDALWFRSLDYHSDCVFVVQYAFN